MRRESTTWVGLGALAASLSACSSHDERTTPPMGAPPGQEVAPTDDRAPVRAATPPPPISGGTLLVTRDGLTIVAADPARDQVSVVALRERRLLHTIELSPGDQPGRLVEDPSGRVFIALRGAGSVAELDVGAGEVTATHAACAAPRGLAVDADRQLLHVACAEGVLASLSLDGGAVMQTLRLAPNLRDVLVAGEHVLVSRLKTAEVLDVDLDSGRYVSARPAPLEQHLELADPSRQSRTLEPDGAFRMVDGGPSGVVLLHQLASTAPIQLEPGDEEPVDESASVPPSERRMPRPDPAGGATAYGGAVGDCSGIVHGAISQMSPGGSSLVTGMPLGRAVLPVDIAVSPDQRWGVVAHAGAADPERPMSGGPMADGPTASLDGSAGAQGRISVHELSDVQALGGPLGDECAPRVGEVDIDGQVTAVAFNPKTDEEAVRAGTWIVAQTREPAALHFIDEVGSGVSATVSLSDVSVRDTGHDLFHRDTGAGIACASCHLEGGDDGHVWHFDPIGPRRTQSVNVGLRGTEPFHWDGDMHDLGMLVDEVFVRRMGGAHQSQPRLDALGEWLFSLEALPPQLPATDPAAERGRALFESAEVGCSGCHSGRALTNNQSYFVGTTESGHELQVPSLVGIGYRAPFLHAGCAETLADRFDPSCGGGDSHGQTSQLSSAEIEDLVAYLRTL